MSYPMEKGCLQKILNDVRKTVEKQDNSQNIKVTTRNIISILYG